MMAKQVHLCAQEENLAKNEGRAHLDFPGKRWIREGGLDGYIR